MNLSSAAEARARQCGRDHTRHMVDLMMASYERRHLSEFCPPAGRLPDAQAIYRELRHWLHMEDRRVRSGGEPWIPIKRARFVAAALTERKRAQQQARRAA